MGSTGRIAEEIGELAVSNGWDSYIAFGRYKAFGKNGNSSKSKIIRIGDNLSSYVHVLYTRILDMHGLASDRATKKFIKKIEKIQPDLIHIHNLHGYYINYKLLFNYLSTKSIPVIWTLHDCWSFTGHCSHFSYINCEKWKTECGSCPKKNAYPASILLDRSRMNFQDKKSAFNSLVNITFIPASYWLGDLLKQSFLSSFPMKVIQNGVDLSVFNIKETDFIKKKYNITGEFIILGVANIWNETKGLSGFIKLNEILDPSQQIFLVGLSKKQIASLPKNMIGIERTENVSDLADLYSLADVYMNLTLEDTFPTTNIEALACGTPVITYRTGGSIEAVSADTGFIVSQGDITGLKQSIEKIRAVNKKCFQERSRQRAIALFNKNDRFMEYIHLYQEVLE